MSYTTSGASDIIFINPLERSSLATGPKTRVPIGSFSLVISTAALSSNLTYEPSERLRSFRVRTITALCTSPFLTFELGMASFTDTTITSPSPAYFLLDPPIPGMPRPRSAPALEASRDLLHLGGVLHVLSPQDPL